MYALSLFLQFEIVLIYSMNHSTIGGFHLKPRDLKVKFLSVSALVPKNGRLISAARLEKESGSFATSTDTAVKVALLLVGDSWSPESSPNLL